MKLVARPCAPGPAGTEVRALVRTRGGGGGSPESAPGCVCGSELNAPPSGRGQCTLQELACCDKGPEGETQFYVWGMGWGPHLQGHSAAPNRTRNLIKIHLKKDRHNKKTDPTATPAAVRTTAKEVTEKKETTAAA